MFRITLVVAIFTATVSPDFSAAADVTILETTLPGPYGTKASFNLSLKEDRYVLDGDLRYPGVELLGADSKAGLKVSVKPLPNNEAEISGKTQISSRNPLNGRTSDAAWVEVVFKVKGKQIISATGEIGATDTRTPHRFEVSWKDEKLATKKQGK